MEALQVMGREYGEPVPNPKGCLVLVLIGIASWLIILYFFK